MPTMGEQMKDKPRIGTTDNSSRIEIYNSNYNADGGRTGNYEHPWTVITPLHGYSFETHAEALQHAIKEAEAMK